MNCNLLKIEPARRKLKFISIKEGGSKQIKWLDVNNVKDSILKYYVNWKFHLAERDIYNSINLYSEPE